MIKIQTIINQNETEFYTFQIKWLLKATKAFTHLFPAEMKTEVARYVGYEA